MQVITTEKTPVKHWFPYMDDPSLWNQIKNVANHPFTFKHVALMPDAHFGYGVPIGCVWATKDVISPNAVGVDIGCGVRAVQTSLKVEDVGPERLKKVLGVIRRTVPVGFKPRQVPVADHRMPDRYFLHTNAIVHAEWERARLQLGTLGGGNHFIEIQKGSDGHVWLMIHSGSRNLGYRVAKHYNELARDLNEKWACSVPKAWDLAFLRMDSEEGRNYMAEMQYCVAFAKQNRDEIVASVEEAVLSQYPDAGFGDPIDVAHNYAVVEKHFGHAVIVHRKGATRARKGQVCLIPGSQGTASYICRGQGNRDSFHSCSHGAGRKLGRNQAKQTLDLAEEQKRLDDLGILHAIHHVNDLDEAAGAYKDIDEVMAQQADLVEIDVQLQPLAVVKG